MLEKKSFYDPRPELVDKVFAAYCEEILEQADKNPGKPVSEEVLDAGILRRLGRDGIDQIRQATLHDLMDELDRVAVQGLEPRFFKCEYIPYNIQIIQELMRELEIPEDSSHPFLMLLENLEASGYEEIISICQRLSQRLGIGERKVRSVVADLLSKKTASFDRYRS
ncbi:hypothetical protein A3J34_00780 [Candidatus Peribacteria bacterium RIFCSPLOWO2_02_FULL_51_10]|nr:MAG: hypothetical protein A3J34_00780 [Candidatus Peribacteria bacterium RIFCSPLOWO2_02_FULL_51_10]